MDRKMYRITINVNWMCIPAAMSVEQYSPLSRKVFCFLSSETFSVAFTPQNVVLVVEGVARCSLIF